MAISKLQAHLWIHGWSLMHGVTAAATAQLPDGGFVLLTTETITAVTAFSKFCGAHWSEAFITAFVKQRLANYVGVRIAQVIAGKVPVAGNALNGVTSAAITETVLWDAYHSFNKKLVICE